jgi:hypothetical protein
MARSSAATVVIFDANDVVLLEIGAGLHLYDLDGDPAGICKAVNAAKGEVDRLVLPQK